MPRFVILTHDHPFLHWDLMLEHGSVLRTWRLLEPPQPGRTVAAERLADHRREYLDYEGPVSGERGTVQRWDAGTYDLPDPARPQLLLLRGSRHALLAEPVSSAGGEQWRFSAAGSDPQESTSDHRASRPAQSE